MSWRWRTTQEFEEMMDHDDCDLLVETTCPSVQEVHPEEFGTCIWTKESGEALIAKCPEYVRECECDLEAYGYCCCMHYFGMGFKGVCEKAVKEGGE